MAAQKRWLSGHAVFYHRPLLALMNPKTRSSCYSHGPCDINALRPRTKFFGETSHRRAVHAGTTRTSPLEPPCVQCAAVSQSLVNLDPVWCTFQNDFHYFPKRFPGYSKLKASAPNGWLMSFLNRLSDDFLWSHSWTTICLSKFWNRLFIF